MAPESERALNESNRTQFESCSEVVERLAVECFVLHHVNEPDRFDRAQAEKILTEWREQTRKGAKHE